LITKDNEQRTAATDGLEYISGLIRRYTQVEHIYLDDDNFPLKGDLQSLITTIYRQVLEYEARAACQFNRNTAYQWVRNVVETDSWKPIIGTIKELETSCDNLTRTIDGKDQRVRASRLESQNHEIRELLKAIHAQEEEQERLHLAELKAGRKDQNDWHRSEEESACYECLRTTDYETNKNRNPVRIPETCEWFLRHPRYRKWLREQGSTWLWVTADPGCGKSVLSRFLIDEYKKGVPTTSTICYYFFKDNSEEGRSATHALCAILHQLFSQNNKLLRHAIPEYKRNRSKLPGLFNELWSIFISAAADPDAGSVVCILDALDECAESTRLPLMRRLANFCLNPELGTRLKFIIVSRPYASISDTFWEENPNVASIQLMGENETEMEDIRVEIDFVIEAKVKQFKSRRNHKGVYDDAHIVVQEKLRSIENRTYLWVALIFPELEKKAGFAKSRLLQLIENIPKSVDEAYERILNQSTDREQARKLLHIVVAAKRPLNLMEMNIALSMKEGASSLEDLEIEHEPSFQTTVRNLCGLFVAIRDSTIYLIHQTAKEFLVARNTTSDHASSVPGLNCWKHSLGPANSNLVLAIICISYLSFDVFECDPLVLREEDNTNTEDKEDGEEKDGREGDRSKHNSEGSQRNLSRTREDYRDVVINYVAMHPFLAYAAYHWSFHLREAESLDDIATQKAALIICASHSDRLQTWFRVYRVLKGYPLSQCPDPTDLMVASYVGLEAMVKSCLTQGAEINAKDTALRCTPLVFAAVEDHEAIVKILLETGADPDIQNDHGDSALMIAVCWRSEPNVKVLLESHADPNIKNDVGDTALTLAARKSNETVVKMLLESNADPNIQDERGRTALVRAARSSDETVVKMLLENDADPNLQDESGETALSTAAHMENVTIVQLFLESNADPNTQAKGGYTALMRAVARADGTLVKTLLEYGAKSKIENSQGDTALAIAKEEKARVNMRLEEETEQNMRDGSLAKRKMLQAIEDMLLEYGTESSETSRDNDEWSTTASTDTSTQAPSGEASTHEEDSS